MTDRDPVVETLVFSDQEGAVACLREHDVLVELCAFTLADGYLDHAWLLPSALIGYLQVRGSTEDFLRLFTGALDAARLTRNRLAEAIALNTLGHVHSNIRQFDQALDLLSKALPIRYEIGEPRGLAVSEHVLATVCFSMGEHDEAARHFNAAIDHWLLTEDNAGRIKSMNGLAWTLLEKGEFAHGARIADEATGLCTALGITDPLVQGTRARAKVKMNDLDGAAQVYRDLFATSLET